MNARRTRKPVTRRPEKTVGEILILPDGRLLAHNLSAALAGLLAELNPGDAAMNRRAGRENPLSNELPN
jgi:hypothetical protein